MSALRKIAQVSNYQLAFEMEDKLMQRSSNRKHKKYRFLKRLVLTMVGFSLLVVGWGSYHWGYLPVVMIGDLPSNEVDVKNISPDEPFRLLENYDFSEGNYSCYVVWVYYDKVEYNLPRVLFTEEVELLDQLKEAFVVTDTGGDIATCESVIILKRDDDIVLQIYIALDAVSGLQSKEYGWLEFEDRDKVVSCLQLMKSLYGPVVFI